MPAKSSDNFEAMQSIISSSDARTRMKQKQDIKLSTLLFMTFFLGRKIVVAVEEYINPGYADYILKKENGDDLLFIEAKKEGAYFEIPFAYSPQEKSSYISIKKLVSDENIGKAVKQVRNYCFDTGCEYAAITNGHEWIFFKTLKEERDGMNCKLSLLGG
ncbi:hypothetical protein ULG90_16425 [Halopseudomonas pachastrellae]|nr:hypothetical protein ULG90_16425 [Halopseudomonas pachastrellae]